MLYSLLREPIQVSNSQANNILNYRGGNHAFDLAAAGAAENSGAFFNQWGWIPGVLLRLFGRLLFLRRQLGLFFLFLNVSLGVGHDVYSYTRMTNP